METSCGLERVKNLPDTVRHDFDIEWSLTKFEVTQLRRGHVFRNFRPSTRLSVNSLVCTRIHFSIHFSIRKRRSVPKMQRSFLFSFKYPGTIRTVTRPSLFPQFRALS